MTGATGATGATGRVSGRVLTCTVTSTGAALAGRLPYEHEHGRLVETVRARWAEVDGFVLVCATGIAVRAIAPLLADKTADPAVVVVDDGGRFAVALTGGHRGGANVLAREVAALLGAEPVVTTATDAAGLPALDNLPGFTATGDIAAVTRAWLDGSPPTISVDPALAGWPLPPALAVLDPAASAVLGTDRVDGAGRSVPRMGRVSTAPTVVVTDRDVRPGAEEVVLRPRSLALGVGSSSGADPVALHRLVVETLAAEGLSLDAVGCVATVDRKASEAAIVDLAAALGAPLRTFPADVLAAMQVPNPSEVVAAAVGTPSVAEAAALAATSGPVPAGPEGGADGRRDGGALVVEKRRSAEATVAVARRGGPEG
ncbi:MAG TPA: cobalamin biosynthesis protein, partial [Acidimicrobiia bacterium]|nr:cobalamin biosynthesis protein [Acidimicrobiia bacterium]